MRASHPLESPTFGRSPGAPRSSIKVPSGLTPSIRGAAMLAHCHPPSQPEPLTNKRTHHGATCDRLNVYSNAHLLTKKYRQRLWVWVCTGVQILIMFVPFFSPGCFLVSLIERWFYYNSLFSVY